MKTLTILGFPLIFGLLILFTVPFQSCDPDDKDECDTCQIVYKPNIYIYPKENLQLTVSLNFPKGGKIIKSIPEYESGWNITVDNNGFIDKTYNYLFYESKQPDIWQHNEGWVVKKTNLKDFFSKNMTTYGFQGREIQDFIEYWIPKLTEFKFYEIYPQNSIIINDVIEIQFSKNPDNILRLFYVVKGMNELPSNNLTEPKIESFNREGFFTTEWGVIIE